MPKLISGEKRKEKSDWQLLEFAAPILENSFVNDEFIIKGIAINETTTFNGHRYIAEELEKAAPELKGKPLLTDHENEVKAIAGRVTNSIFNPLTKSIEFEGRVNNTSQGKMVRELIKEGDLSTVSIGAFADDLTKDEESGDIIAKGIKIVELSFTPVPADQGATFAAALNNNYQIKEHVQLTERRYREMTDKKSDKVVEENTQLLEELKSLKEKNKLLEEEKDSLTKESNSLKEEKRESQIQEYKRLCSEKKVQEKDVTNMSEETILTLIDHLKELEVKEEKVQEKEKVEMKSKKVAEIPEEEANIVIEGNNAWMMPDKSRWMKLHNDHSVGKVPTVNGS